MTNVQKNKKNKNKNGIMNVDYSGALCILYIVYALFSR